MPRYEGTEYTTKQLLKGDRAYRYIFVWECGKVEPINVGLLHYYQSKWYGVDHNLQHISQGYTRRGDAVLFMHKRYLDRRFYQTISTNPT